ncbi:MAG: hypothetical protein J3K34DRAFT_297831 [Monoraphidium minutum]|nr:MAG: hypothetical protein J3K34DRAFT_297831 [Monoraphidium minutum]
MRVQGRVAALGALARRRRGGAGARVWEAGCTLGSGSRCHAGARGHGEGKARRGAASALKAPRARVCARRGAPGGGCARHARGSRGAGAAAHTRRGTRTHTHRGVSQRAARGGRARQRPGAAPPLAGAPRGDKNQRGRRGRRALRRARGCGAAALETKLRTGHQPAGCRAAGAAGAAGARARGRQSNG